MSKIIDLKKQRGFRTVLFNTISGLSAVLKKAIAYNETKLKTHEEDIRQRLREDFTTGHRISDRVLKIFGIDFEEIEKTLITFDEKIKTNQGHNFLVIISGNHAEVMENTGRQPMKLYSGVLHGRFNLTESKISPCTIILPCIRHAAFLSGETLVFSSAIKFKVESGLFLRSQGVSNALDGNQYDSMTMNILIGEKEIRSKIIESAYLTHAYSQMRQKLERRINFN